MAIAAGLLAFVAVLVSPAAAAAGDAREERDYPWQGAAQQHPHVKVRKTGVGFGRTYVYIYIYTLYSLNTGTYMLTQKKSNQV